MSVAVAKERIDTVEVVFTFDAEYNQFSAYMDVETHYVKGKTLDECRRKARAVIRRRLAKIDIKAHVVDAYPEEYMQTAWHDARRETMKNNLVRPVVLRGIDGRSNDPLIEYEDSGRKTKKSGYSWREEGGGIVVRRLSNQDIEEYKRIKAAKDEADDAHKAFLKKHEIKNLTEFLAAEVEKKVAALDAAAGDADAVDDPRTGSKSARSTRRRS